MRTEMADELLEFIRKGDLWEPDALRAVVESLTTEARDHDDPNSLMLAQPLTALLTRLEIGPVTRRFAEDVEGILYPRLWKVLEAAWDALPDSEMRTRLEVLNRRLARHFVDEEQAAQETSS